MKRAYIVLIIIIVAILAMRPFLVFADNSAEIDDLNKKIAEKNDVIKKLQKTIDAYNDNIKQKQVQSNSLRTQLAILDNEIARLRTEIDLKKEKIKQTQLRIDELKLSIDDKEKTIERQKVMIENMVRDIYRNQDKGYVEILLTNKTLSDFYNQLTYEENINVDLGRSVKALKLAKADLESKKQDVEDQKKNLEDLKAQLEDKKNNFNSESTYKQDVLSQTLYSEAKYKTLVSSLKSQYQAIENEVRSYEEEVRKKMKAQQGGKILSDGSPFSWPVPSHIINATFHDPDYPYRNIFEHSGIDLHAAEGTPVKAAAAGYVGRARTCTTASCYTYVLIIHTGNLSTLYGHLSQIVVSTDQFVNRGDIIGYSGGRPGAVGSGPFVTGPHLHFEVRLNGIPVNPIGYLSK